jgi:arylformamidase
MAMLLPAAELRSAAFSIWSRLGSYYLNEKLGLDPAEAEPNSPVRHLPVTAGEVVVAYGVRELPELCRQSIEYARAWTERGLPGSLLPVNGADHFTILDALAQPEGVLMRVLLAMLGR